MEDPGYRIDLRDREDVREPQRGYHHGTGKIALKDAGDMHCIQNRKLKKTLTREPGLDMRFFSLFHHIKTLGPVQSSHDPRQEFSQLHTVQAIRFASLGHWTRNAT